MVSNKDINWIYDHIKDCHSQAKGLEKSILKDILGLFEAAPEFQMVMTLKDATDEELRKLLEGARHECVILPGGQEASIELLEPATKWIPVTEQLPKTDGRFMVTIKGKSGKPHVEMRNFSAGSQKWESQLGYVEENILAWKARPRPYGVKPRQADTELYGHWIYWDGWCGNHDRRIDDATCSVCGYKHPTVRATKEEWDTPKFLSDTCPGCGAKMKKGEGHGKDY